MIHLKKFLKENKLMTATLCLLLSVLLVVSLLPNGGFAFASDQIQTALSQAPQEQNEESAPVGKTYTINFVSNEVALDKTSMEFNEGVACQLEAISFNNKSLKFLGWSLGENLGTALIADNAVIDEEGQVLATDAGNNQLIKLTDYADESLTINLFAVFESVGSVATSNSTMDKGPISEGQDWEDDYVDMPQTTNDMGSRILAKQNSLKPIINTNSISDEESPFIEPNLTWKRLNDDDLPDKTTNIDDNPSDNVNQRFQFQLDFSFKPDTHFDKESIEIELDAQYWISRLGYKTGTMSLGVPAYPSAASSFAYTYNAREEKYIITNTQEVEGNKFYSIQFSIKDIFPQTIKDQSQINFALNISASINGNTYTTKTNDISATMHTAETLQNAYSNNGAIFKTWTDAYNNGCRYTKPERSEDYIYVNWYVYTKAQGNKNFSLDVEAELIDSYEGSFIFDANEDGIFKNKIVNNDYVNSGFSIGCSIWAAFPKENFEISKQAYDLKLDSRWILTESDDGPEPETVSKSTSNTVQYTAPQSFTVYLNWEDNNNEKGKRPSSKAVEVQGKHYNDKRTIPVELKPGESESNLWNVDLYNLDGEFDYTVNNDIEVDAYYYYRITDSQTESTTITAYYYEPGYDVPITTQKYKYDSNYNDKDRASRKDAALKELVNGKKASNIKISNSVETIAMDKTLGDGMDPSDPNSYHKKLYKVIHDFDGFNLEGVGELEAGDYNIRQLELIDNSYLQLIQYPGFSPVIEGLDAKDSDHNDIKIFAQSSDEAEPIEYATASWDYSSNTYYVSFLKEGCSLTGKIINFPEGKNIVRAYLETSTACTGINTSCNITIDINPTDKIKEGINKILEDNLFGMSDLETYMTYGLYDEFGSAYFDHSAKLDSYLHGYLPKLASKLSTNLKQDEPDWENKLIPLHFQQTFVSQSNIENQTDYLNLLKSGEIADLSQGINTWFTLLPKGVIANLTSIKVQDGDLLVSVEAQDNFRDSGRTMLICKTKNALHTSSTNKYNPGIASVYGCLNTLQINFDASYSFTDKTVYKNELSCNSAFEADIDWIGNVKGYIGEPDDPTFGNHVDSKDAIDTDFLKYVFTDLDEDHQTDWYNFVYAKKNHTVQVDLNFEGGFIKEAAVEDDSFYSVEQTVVHEGQGYNYRTTFTLTDNNKGKVNAYDLVMIDKLENIGDPVSAWRGYFNYVNLDKLYQLGISPVVYASTQDVNPANGLFEIDDQYNYIDENGNTEDDNDFKGNFKLTAGWQKLEDIDDYSQITAIAVDATHTKITDDGKYEKGSKFTLVSINELSIDIHMIAPAGNQVPSGAFVGDGYNADLNGHAFNKSYLNMIQGNEEGYDAFKNGFAVKQDVPCQVGIVRQNTNVSINFNDDDNRDGMRPETLTISLLDESGTEVAKKENITVPKNGVLDLTFEGVPSWKAGKYVKYTIKQEADESHKTSFQEDYESITATVISSSDKTASFLIEDKHEPEITSLFGNITWDDLGYENYRPSSFDLDLIDSSGVVTQTINVTKPADDNWNYEFFDVYKYENEGLPAKYTLVAKVDNYKPSYTPQIQIDERYNIDITNKYYPYADLIITQKEYLDATLQAKEKSFEFSVEIKQGTQILPKPFNCEIFNAAGESIKKDEYSSGNKVEIPEGCKLVIRDIPAHATYSVYQYDLPGFTQEDVINTEGELLSYAPANSIFNNRYSSFIDFSPNVTKVLKNHELAKYQFKFTLIAELYPESENKAIRSAANGQSVKVDDFTWSAPVIFNPVKITNLDLNLETGEKVKGYFVEETVESIPGYTYDGSFYKYNTITFTDNGDGTISESDTEWVFTNQYNAEGSYSPKAWVSLQDGTLTEGQFSFELSKLKPGDDDTYVIDDSFSSIEKTNVADGTIDFINADGSPTLNFNETNIGKDYYYIINQTKMTDEFTYSYDKSIKGIKVSVIDNNDGTLSIQTKDVSVVKDEDGNYLVDESLQVDAPIFYNRLSPGNLEIQNLWQEGASIGPNPYIEREYHVVLSGENVPESIDYTIEPIESTDTFESVEKSSLQTDTNEVNSDSERANKNTNNEPLLTNIVNGVSQGLQKLINSVDNAASAVSNTLFAQPQSATAANLEADLDHIKCEFSVDEADDNKGVLTFTGVSGPIEETDTCWDATTSDGTSPPWANYVSKAWDHGKYKNSKVFIDETCKHVSVKKAYRYFSATSIESISGLEYFNTSECTDMSYMFYYCGAQSLNLSNFDTKNVKSMQYMFAYLSLIEELDLSSFDTSNVEAMVSMFESSKKLRTLDLSSFNTSNVTTMFQMFFHCESLKSCDVSSFNTTNVSTFYHMFSYCNSLEKLDLSNFKFKSDALTGSIVTDIAEGKLKYFDFSSFYGTYSSQFNSLPPSLDTIILSDSYLNNAKNLLSPIITAKKTPNLKGQNGSTWNTLPEGNNGISFDLPGSPGLIWTKDYTVYDSTDNSLTFYGCDKQFSEIPNKDTCTFYATPCNYKVDGTSPWMSHKDVTKNVSFDKSFCSSYIKSCYSWFYDFSNNDLDYDFSNFDASNVTLMNVMFYGNTELKTLDLSYFKTSNVTETWSMFENCSQLENINIASWDTSKVKDMHKMFKSCGVTSFDFSSWNLSSLTNMCDMFCGCSNVKEIDFSNKFHNQEVYIAEAFDSCSSIEYIDFSGNSINNGTHADSSVFNESSNLKTINLDGSSYTSTGNVYKWFCFCSSLEKIDISGLNCPIQMGIFTQCTNLKSITFGTSQQLDCITWGLPDPPSNDEYTGYWIKSDYSAKPTEKGSTALANLYMSNPELYSGEWIWEPNVKNPYTVKYDANGGSGSMAASKFTYNEEATFPECTLFKFNSDFVGWKDEEKGVTYTDGTIPANTYAEGDEVTLKAQWEPKSGGGTITGSEFDIAIPATGKAVLKDLPAGISYSVTQKEMKDYTLVSSSDTVGVIGIKEVPEDSLSATYTKTSEAKFYNKYGPAAPASTSVNFTGLVNLDNKPALENMFSFTSSTTKDNPIHNMIGGSINFGSITYNTPGEYTYTINQVIGSDSLIVYDNTIYTVVVTITKNDETNLLESSVAISNGEETCPAIIFNNTYKTGSVNFENIVEKGSSVSDLDFGYEISFTGVIGAGITKVHYIKSDGTEDDLSMVNAKGSFTLKKSENITFTEIPNGANYEINGASVPKGWTKTAQTNTSGSVVGGNTYNASMTYVYGANASADIQAWVFLKGNAVEFQQFSFDLLDSEGHSILPEDVIVSNDAPDEREEVDGVVNENYLSAPIAFNNIIKIWDAGEYTYTIKQITKEGDGIIYDEAPCTVTLNATDRGDGTYAVEYSLDYGEVGKTRFINEIDANGSLQFSSAIKDGTGNPTVYAYPIAYKFDFLNNKGQQLSGEYDYKLINQDGTTDTGLMNSGDIMSLSNKQQLFIKLPVGVSYRVISVETNPAFDVYSYDGVLYTNKTSSEGSITDEAKQASGSCVQAYNATGSVSPVASVIFTNGILQADDFNFTIKNLDSGKTETVSNDALGNIAFAPQLFNGSQAGTSDEPCEFFYEISQNPGKSEIITYDTRKFTANVTVKDMDASGALTCNITYTDEDGNTVEKPVFTNSLTLNDLPDTGMIGIIASGSIALVLLGLFIYLIRRNRIKS